MRSKEAFLYSRSIGSCLSLSWSVNPQAALPADEALGKMERRRWSSGLRAQPLSQAAPLQHGRAADH
jgi:hypothetical protein